MKLHKFNNGDRINIGKRFIGWYVGICPKTNHHVVYNINSGDYDTYHRHEIEPKDNEDD